MFDLGYPLNYKRQVLQYLIYFLAILFPPPPIILSSFISSTLSWHHSEWQSTTMLMFVHISYYLRNLVISHWVLSDLIGVVWSHTTLKWCLDMLFLAGMVFGFVKNIYKRWAPGTMFHVVHMLGMFDQSCTMFRHSVLLACFLCSSLLLSVAKKNLFYSLIFSCVVTVVSPRFRLRSVLC